MTQTTTPGAHDEESWARRFFLADAGGRDVRLDIQGLRALAVTMVLLFHAGVPLHGGFVGVDVFFVISGFIITGALVRELRSSGRISPVRFYARRARRLLPAATTVVVSTVVLTFLLLPRLRWPGVVQDAWASTFYAMNWRLWHESTDYAAQDQAHSPLQHFWSLAVEEQFYLLWPLLLVIVAAIARRRARRAAEGRDPAERRAPTSGLLLALALVALPSLAYSVWYTAASPEQAYFSTGTRLWELAAGGGVAILAHRLVTVPRRVAWALAWAGLSALLASPVLLDAAVPFPGSAALLPVLGTAVLIAMAPAAGGSGPATLLSLRPLVRIGDLSYSLYLWHWPLLVLAEARWGPLTVRQGLVVTAVGAVAAVTAKRYVEDPVRERRSLLVPARALAVGAYCTVGSVAATLALHWGVILATPPAPPLIAHEVVLHRGQQTTSSPRLGAEVLGQRAFGDPAGRQPRRVDVLTPDPSVAAADVDGASCVATATATDPEPCLYGDRTSPVLAMLVGDSHAGQWLRPLAAIAADRGWLLEVYLKQNCPYAPGVDFEYNARPYDACRTWNARLAARVASARPAVLLTSAEATHPVLGPTGQPLLPEIVDGIAAPRPVSVVVAAFRSAFETVVAGGGEVVALSDSPRPGLTGLDPVLCVSEHRDDLRPCTFDRTAARTDAASLDAAVEGLPGTTRVDLTDAICPSSPCPTVVGGVLVYRDTNHLTATYAGTLASRIDRATQGVGPR